MSRKTFALALVLTTIVSLPAGAFAAQSDTQASDFASAQPASDRSDEPVSDRAVTDKVVSDVLVTDRHITDKVVTDRLVTDKFVTERHITDRFVSDRLVTDVRPDHRCSDLAGSDAVKCRCRLAFDDNVDLSLCRCLSHDGTDIQGCKCRLFEQQHGYPHRRCRPHDRPTDLAYLRRYLATVL